MPPHAKKGYRGSNQYARRGAPTPTQDRRDLEDIAFAFHPDRDTWIAAGVTDLAVVDRLTAAGVTANEMLRWNRQGVSDVDEVIAWAAEGFTATDLHGWHVYRFDPPTARRWRDAGFRGGQTASHWHDHASFADRPEEAHAWMTAIARNQFNDPQAVDRAHRWESHGFDPKTAPRWAGQKFTAQRAAKWRDAGFGPQQAAEWRDAGCTPAAALELKSQGVTPDAARKMRKP